MTLSDLFGYIVYQHPPTLVGAVSALSLFGMARLRWGREAATKIEPLTGWLFRPLIWLVILGAISLTLLNLFFPALVVIYDPHLGSVSYLLTKGWPLYHSLDYPARYALLYGPANYILTAAVFKVLGPSLFATKLVNGAATLALIAYVGICLHRHAAQPWHCLAVFLVLLVMFLNCAPLLLLCVAVAFHLHFFSQGRFRQVVVGICIGVATGVKFTSGIYFVPIIFDLLFVRRFWDFALLTFSAVAVALLPFALPMVSLQNYLVWVRAAAAHGLSAQFFYISSDWLVYQLSVLLATLLFARQDCLASPAFTSRRVVIGGACTLGLAMIVASKAGAGSHHLYPAFPALIILLAPLARIILRQVERRGWFDEVRAMAALFLVTVMAFRMIPMAHNHYYVARVPGRAITHDVETILQRHPDKTIALGDAETMSGEWQDKPALHGRTTEPLLVFAGMPLVYETLALMDMQKAGLPIPEATVKDIRQGKIDLWLFPKGREPFNIYNWYGLTQQVFSPSFREAFFAHYQYDESSEFYDIWKFTGHPRSEAEKPAPTVKHE